MTRKLWAAGDGNGGYDIGEGNFTIAHVRNLRIQDGYRVAKEYQAAIGCEFDTRATAMLFKEAPAMIEALREVWNLLPAIDPHSPEMATYDRIRAILARIEGAPTAQPAGPIGEAVAAALHRSRMATEINARKAPAATAAAVRALKLAATDIGATLAHENPGFDRAGFLAAAGFRGEG
jgi:hypothetical protein